MDNSLDISTRVDHYRRVFGHASPELFASAPGRVNLIGEHTDYHDGLVLPIAMSASLYVLAGRREPREIVVYSTAFDETVAFSAQDPGGPDDYPDLPAWSRYVRGVASLLRRQGMTLRGGWMLIDSDVPVGGGISSSAALEIASAMALLALAVTSMEPVPLALLARQAEHEFAHSPCGIMDQFICLLGKANHALLLDCRSREFRYVPMPREQVELIVMDTGVRHAIGGGEYALRQQQGRAGLAVLQASDPRIAALRDASMEQLLAHQERMEPVVFRRCRHVVGEIQRTREAAVALETSDWEAFGRLMNASHASLRDDYEVSCTELDALVELAVGTSGVYGARMTGGGFGGCVIALARKDTLPALRQAVAEKYNKCFAKPATVYTTFAEKGAAVYPLRMIQ